MLFRSHLAPFDGVIRKAMAKKPQDRYGSAEELRQAMEGALVKSVAMQEEAKSPGWWVESPSTTELVSEEESTGTYEMAEEKTVITRVVIEETVKMPQLALEAPLLPEWAIDAALMPTEPIAALATVRAHPTWVQRVGGFWKRVSKLWQLFRIQGS